MAGVLRHTRHIDGLERADVPEDSVQLTTQPFGLLRGQGEPGQPCERLGLVHGGEASRTATAVEPERVIRARVSQRGFRDSTAQGRYPKEVARARTGRRPAFAVIGACLLASVGCGEELEVRPEAEAATEEPLTRLGQVHMVLRPFGTPNEPAMSVTARFVEYRGVDENYARQRSNMITLPWDTLAPGTCRRADTPTTGTFTEGPREVSLIDGGDLRIELGGVDLAVPLALVPDLLPYVSGVEYLYQRESIPPLAAYPDGSVPLSVRMDGSGIEELPPFEVGTRVPKRVRLTDATVEDDGVEIRWRPVGTSDEQLALTLHLADAEITCLMPDAGQARLSRAALEELVPDQDLATWEEIDVSASRLEQLSVDAGQFDDIELVVENRDRRTFAL